MRRTLLIATCIAMLPLRVAAEPTPPEAVPSDATPPEATPPEATPAVTPPELPPSEVVPATPIEPAPVEPPPPEPVPAPTVEVMDPALRLPPRPRYDGRRLLAAAYSLTGIAWALTLVGVGVGLGKCASESCAERRGKTFAAFYITGSFTQLAGGLVAGYGAQRRGIYDAWRYATSGRPQRNAVAFMVSGGIMSVASLGGWLAILFTGARDCTDDCSDAEFVGYLVGEQALLTTMTIGGGLFDYGRGYRRANRHYSGLTLAPWSPRGRGGGAAIAGRF
ncbi:MAG TPA: hypothetical protein VG755_10225 [Nannocystaceae bacterium]|nr:hypothetical protein [Nannocystaceae bacterium]